LIAATILAASTASAQVYSSGCRGATMSDLARCAAKKMPPPLAETEPEIEGVAPLVSQTVRPSALGGALQPSNLRSLPPVVGGGATTPALTADSLPDGVIGLEPLASLTDDPTSPFYGLARNSSRRQMRRFDPFANIGAGSFGLPDR
jgi:hypothetical protein